MKKAIRSVFISLAVFVVAIIIYFLCAFFGNPVSYLLSKNSAEDYIEEKYAEYNLEIEDVAYDFKSSHYYAKVVSPDSIDTYFTVYFDLLGRPKYDTFDNVTSGYNTAVRLGNEYRKLVDSVSEDISRHFVSDVFYGEIKISDSGEDFVGKIPYGIDLSELKLDSDYDINKIGKEAGHIVIYYEETELTAEKAAERLILLKEIFDKNNINFYAIDFIAQEPKADANSENRNEFVVREFLYSDIYEKDLPIRLQEAADDLQGYYSAMDSQK